MDLDGFIKLDDQAMKEAASQAEVASRWLQNEVLWQQAVKASLENLALWWDIKWDAQAHASLERAMHRALAEVREIKNAQRTLKQKLLDVTFLVDGASSREAVVAGWIAHKWLGQRLFFALDASPPSPPPMIDGCYAVSAWRHPERDVTAADTYTGDTNAQAVLNWARMHNYFPAYGGPAWLWMMERLHQLNNAARAEAAAIEKRRIDAEAAAHAVEQQDWDRLKKNGR